MRFNDQLINVPSLNNVINRSPLTIKPDSFVVEAILLMSQEGCSNYAPKELNFSLDLNPVNQASSGCVLVVEEAILLGIFTEKHVVRLIASGIDLSTVMIAQVMTQPVVTLRQSDSPDIFIALSLLRQHQTRYLPVLDDRGRLQGIITETSLLQAFDLAKMVGVVEGLQQYLQKPKDEFSKVNQHTEIEQVRHQTQNNLKLWVEAQSAEILQINQELQLALEELQVVEEELREQNQELAVARELVELERQCYQDLFEFAPDGYLVTDIAGIIQEANRAAAILLAVRQEYLVKKPLIIFIPHQDRQNFTIRLMNSQQEQQWEAYLKPRGGKAFPASIRVAAMYDSQGKQVGWRWLICDISEREQANESLRQANQELEQRVEKQTAELIISNVLLQQEITDRQRAEVALQQSENLYRQLVESQIDIIIRIDLHFQITFANAVACQTFGWKEDEFRGQSFSQFLHPDDLPEVMKDIAALGSSPHPLTNRDLRALTVNGVRWFQWNAIAIRNDKKEVVEIQGVGRDITEKKQLEEQFFRTQRLESLGILAGGIAHDLNNILTPILAAAQLVQRTFLRDEEQSEQLLALVEINAKRGAALVKQILSFARGYKGERTIIQVEYLISEIIQIAKQTFPKSIEFSTVIPKDIWAVTGETTQLHQVLMNLVVNARDALPDGGRIKISAENKFIDQAYTRMNLDAKVGHYIVISVADNGIGIPPEILDRIFEPFFTTKDVNTATGLGLSTVLGIIRNHNGFIKVSSNVDRGSKFDLFLPAVKATQIFSIEEMDLPPGEGELILVVDDEAQIREIATIILKNHNYKILTASNGIEAIALYAQHKHQINAVLMNIMMPEMDGITAIRTLQKMNNQVQIIVCSGLNSMEVFTQAADANVQAVLSKPYTARELLQTLHHLFRDSAELRVRSRK
ncbi:MAG: PAS domain S-box protein [Nostoc sp.]|uniref:PAS domain S-box protein n=1 Tax=Nostoc sp. TaxID=1180 RepID=UPI002FFC07FB